MRLAFLGSPPFAEPAFAALADGGFDVAGLVTAPPRRAGRGRREQPNPLVEKAEACGVPVLRPESARDAEFQRAFAGWRPDLGVVVSYGQILDDPLLGIPVHGCVNVHGSLLPRWRGASPVQAALLAGDARTGVSLQRVVRKLDAGAVLAERPVPIEEREDAPTLTARLAEAGAGLLTGFLREVAEGPLPPGAEQDPAAVTHCRRIHKEAGEVDWSRPAAEIDRLVRAMAGWPCAQTRMPDGSLLRIHRGHPAEGGERDPSTGEPGSVLTDDAEFGVICGDGSVYLVEELQREGRARMDAVEFLRGTTLEAGARLRPV